VENRIEWPAAIGNLLSPPKPASARQILSVRSTFPVIAAIQTRET
jgi:hypothetical protein